MRQESARSTGIYLSCALLVILAAGAGVSLVRLASPEVSDAWRAAAPALASGQIGVALGAAQSSGFLVWLLIPTLGPLAIALILLVASRSSVPTPEEAGPPAGVEPNSSGLRLLAALQEEARLVDFVREDLDGYSDEEVGGAARGIHSALRKALEDRLEVGPILNGEDGDKVEVPVGFDPTLIRVTGSPQGEPPYQGVLRHGGWRASGVRLPIATEGSDPTVLAPAEVEVGEP